MSKRYGRNQRRRARQRIEELETAHRMDRALLVDQRNRIESQQAVIERVANTLGRHFADLPPETQAVRYLQGRFEMLPPQKASDIDPYSFHRKPSVEETVVTACELLEYEQGIGFDDLTRRMHVTVRTPEGRFAYAATYEAVASNSPDWVAQCMVNGLQNTIRKHLEKKHE